jgi:hypothetical protein
MTPSFAPDWREKQYCEEVEVDRLLAVARLAEGQLEADR